ncbi:hypothetical protein TNCT_188041 [Trichonephila clavata]|uniref:Uncharacterized protein n=1 Tax=Trichonephila clavata TaxID=2740835 RepID=A0A8X6J0L2_TRICU|nr:hypothetical protein TNCT_188041 [Trichonephila clavata]
MNRNMNDFLMCQSVSDAFQISHEGLTGKVQVNEDDNKYLLTDMPAEVGSMNFDFLNNSANQIRFETPNESCALRVLPDPNNFNNYSGIKHPNNIDSDYNIDEPCTSSGIRHWRENNAQSNTFLPFVSPEINEKKFNTLEVNPYSKTNQLPSGKRQWSETVICRS